MINTFLPSRVYGMMSAFDWDKTMLIQIQPTVRMGWLDPKDEEPIDEESVQEDVSLVRLCLTLRIRGESIALLWAIR